MVRSASTHKLAWRSSYDPPLMLVTHSVNGGLTNPPQSLLHRLRFRESRRTSLKAPIVLFNLCSQALGSRSRCGCVLGRLRRWGRRRLHRRLQLINRFLNICFCRSKSISHHFNGLCDRFLHLRNLLFGCHQTLLHKLGACTEQSAACPRARTSARTRSALVLVVTPNDRSTSETLWQRSSGDWRIKRAGRTQRARGIKQSARLNTARLYARRRGGPGQAVLRAAGTLQ